MTRRLLALACLLMMTATAHSAVLCASKAGNIRLRVKCKHKETQVDTGALGLQTPGPVGPTGATGLTGPAGAGINITCPDDPPDETNLMFPFVTNQGGFDTGISIANTGKDSFGTTGSKGVCTFDFFGSSAPTSPVTTGQVLPGTNTTTLASTIAPGFQGYMVARCKFPFAHGFAFISDIGARNLAMGYLPLVVCSHRKASPVEQLLP
jgi:hypothetical protein